MRHMRRARRVRYALVLASLAVCLVCTGAVPAVAEPLPTNPELIRGALDNGLTYIIKKHGNPAGGVGLWLHVASGSLNETDGARGIAHYLEHMAFNGSAARFPRALFPIAGYDLRARPECLHGVRADDVSARPAGHQVRDPRQGHALPFRRGDALEPHAG
ncbi:MAG: insulinase family protein [Deltaproteobacteria bacterium]|nr:insulinase family protein [Deltaproteobacteria bacterium]